MRCSRRPRASSARRRHEGLVRRVGHRPAQVKQNTDTRTGSSGRRSRTPRSWATGAIASRSKATTSPSGRPTTSPDLGSTAHRPRADGVRQSRHMGDIHVTSRQQFLAASEAKVIHAPDQLQVGALVNTCSERVRNLFSASAPTTRSTSSSSAATSATTSGRCTRPTSTTTPASAAPLVQASGTSPHPEGNIPNYTDFPTSSPSTRSSSTATAPAPSRLRHHRQPRRVLVPLRRLPRRSATARPARRATRASRRPQHDDLRVHPRPGPTYGTVVTDPRSPTRSTACSPRRFLWYYSAFTPWADYAVWLPKQVIVGMAWGDGESMISVGNWEQGWAPARSIKGMSTSSSRCSRKSSRGTPEAPGGQRNVILTTHFTFASFAEKFRRTTPGPRTGAARKRHIFYKVGKTPGCGACTPSTTWHFELNREESTRTSSSTDGRPGAPVRSS